MQQPQKHISSGTDLLAEQIIRVGKQQPSSTVGMTCQTKQAPRMSSTVTDASIALLMIDYGHITSTSQTDHTMKNNQLESPWLMSNNSWNQEAELTALNIYIPETYTQDPLPKPTGADTIPLPRWTGDKWILQSNCRSTYVNDITLLPYSTLEMITILPPGSQPQSFHIQQ